MAPVFSKVSSISDTVDDLLIIDKEETISSNSVDNSNS